MNSVTARLLPLVFVITGFESLAGPAPVEARGESNQPLPGPPRPSGDTLIAAAGKAVADLTAERGPEDPATLTARSKLAVTLDDQGRYTAAETEHRAVLLARRRVLGPEHPHTLNSWNCLAQALNAQGKSAEAEAEHRAVLKIRERVQGPEHPDTLRCLVNLAEAVRAQGRNEEAEAAHRAVLALMKRVLGPEHRDTLTCYYNVALCLEAQGEASARRESQKPGRQFKKKARQLLEAALSYAEAAQRGGERVLGAGVGSVAPGSD